MIQLTRLSGTTFLLNADLIERVDSTPDTVITLVDGKKYVVSETAAEVVDAIVAFRGEIVALGTLLDAVRPLGPRQPASHAGHAGHAGQAGTTAGRLAAVAQIPSARPGEASTAASSATGEQ